MAAVLTRWGHLSARAWMNHFASLQSFRLREVLFRLSWYRVRFGGTNTQSGELTNVAFSNG